MSQSRMVGIGVTVKACTLGGFLVTALLQHSCARPHLRVGDRIMCIDGTSTQGLNQSQMRQLMLGDVATTINITIACGLGKTKQYLSLTFERGHPDHTSASAVAFLASAAVPSEYGELWAAHGAALPAFGMSRAEDLLKIDLFHCEPSRSPMNSISVQEVDIAYKNSSCDFRRLYSFGIQDDDSKAVPASSPNLCHSLDSSIGDAAISVSLLKDTYVQFIAPSRDMIISKCKVFRHTTWIRSMRVLMAHWRSHVELMCCMRGRIWKLERRSVRQMFDLWFNVAYASRWSRDLRQKNDGATVKAALAVWKSVTSGRLHCSAASLDSAGAAGVSALMMVSQEGNEHTRAQFSNTFSMDPSCPSCPAPVTPTSHRHQSARNLATLDYVAVPEIRTPIPRSLRGELPSLQTSSIVDDHAGHNDILTLSRSYRRTAGMFEWLSSTSSQHSLNKSEYYLRKGTQTLKRQKFQEKDVLVADTLTVDMRILKSMARARLSQSQLFCGLISALCFVAIYISAVFMQLDAADSFAIVAPMRALLAESQQQAAHSGDMRGFYDIGHPKDWWHWYLNIFSASLRDGSKTGYNGQDLPNIQMNKTNWQNHLLGGWTLQQWRSDVADCSPISVNFRLCPGDRVGDVGPYGGALVKDLASNLQAPFKFSKKIVVAAGRTSSAEGYFADVTLDPDKMNDSLLRNNWVDHQTRRLRVTIEAWNLALDHVVVMNWNTEFNTGGHSKNFFSASVVRVRYYDKPEDRIRLALEVLIALFCLIDLYSDWVNVSTAYKDGFLQKYVQNGWNISHHVQSTLLIVCVAMWLDIVNSPPLLSELRQEVFTNGFTDSTLTDVEILQLSIVADKFSNYLLLTSVHILTLIPKLLKCFRVDQRLAEITNILTLMTTQLSAHCISFSTIFLLMTYMAYIFFGANLEDWSNMIFSIGSAVDTFLGNSIFDELMMINPFAAYAWYFLFIFLLVFVIINIVVSVIESSAQVNFTFRVNNPHLEDSILKTGVIFVINSLRHVTSLLGISLTSIYKSFRFQSDSTTDPAFYYDFAEAALVMLDAADFDEEQRLVSVQLFCAHLEAKGYSCDCVRLVLHNFFECMCSQHAGCDGSPSTFKSQTLEPEFASPDAKVHGTVACQAENFIHKSIVAALLPHKEAMLNFAQFHVDTFQSAY